MLDRCFEAKINGQKSSLFWFHKYKVMHLKKSYICYDYDFLKVLGTTVMTDSWRQSSNLVWTERRKQIYEHIHDN